MAFAVSTETIRQYIDKGLRDLPAIPIAVTKVLELTSNGTSSATEIEAVIASDSALTTKVLRVVNSPYFGLSKQVFSISQAVIVLGMYQIRNISLSIGALSIFKSQDPRARELQAEVWDHSLAAACAAQLIASQKKFTQEDCETVFIGALLHDVGRLFLLTSFSAAYERALKLAQGGDVSMLEAELEQLGVDHATMGQHLAMHWRFPEDLVLLIGRHEGPFEGEVIPTLYAVHAADRLATDLLGSKEVTEISALDPKVSTWLSLDESGLAALFASTTSKMGEITGMLGI